MKRIFAVAIVFAIAITASTRAASPDDLAPVETFLHNRFDSRNDCMVIGFVDAAGSQIVAAGKLDNGTDTRADADTLFFIGSVSKTFTTLLLQDMADHGELKLDDPLQKFLPPEVKVPSRSGREIALLDLATHTAALPMNPPNMIGKTTQEQYETYTTDRMYDFLSSFTLPRDPGAEFAYSNVGMALLGNALERKAGTSYETLIKDRICTPLQMHDTCLTLTPELRTHLAMGHENGNVVGPWQLQAYAPAGCIHSTAKDLLKYAAAQAGLGDSPLVKEMAATHVIRHEDTLGTKDVEGIGSMGHTAMDWVDRYALQPEGMAIMGHAGGAGSYHAFVGFDSKQHRAVVVLSTCNDLSVEAVGYTLLQRLPLTENSALVFAHDQVGIGVMLTLDPNGALRITKVVPQSPADQAGIAAGWLIRKVDDVDLAGKALKDSVKLLRGDAGSVVKIDVEDDKGETHTTELTRRKFTLQ